MKSIGKDVPHKRASEGAGRQTFSSFRLERFHLLPWMLLLSELKKFASFEEGFALVHCHLQEMIEGDHMTKFVDFHAFPTTFAS